MKKVFKKVLFMALLVVGFSMTAMAQKQDNDKDRPKKDPPQIIVPDKERPKDRPKDDNSNKDNRPKKPEEENFVSDR